MKNLPLLSKVRLTKLLKNASFTQDIDLHVLSEIDSTNRYLKDLQKHATVSLCCAEKQSNGRGRFGRPWNSPFGENIYLSLAWKLSCKPSQLSSLSLVVGLSVLDALKKNTLAENIFIKWPNDLMWKDKKLAGILIEFSEEAHDFSEVIIGIGLNVNTDTRSQILAEKPCCSLYEITGNFYDRNCLIINILEALEKNLLQFVNDNFVSFMKSWQAVDYLAKKYISVAQINRIISGYACGITEQGELRVLEDSGKEYHVTSGEASLNVLS